MSKILALVLTVLLLPLATQAQEGGDVCNIRPDLCDEGGGTPEPDLPPPVVPARTLKRKPAKQPASQQRKVRPARKVKRSASNCRVAGQPYNLDSADLPVCGSAPVQAKQEEPKKERTTSMATGGEISFEQLVASEEAPVVRRPKRAPASAASSAISFESYMHNNANHPAIANKRAGERQKAFQDAKPAAIAVPDIENGTGVRENARQVQQPAESSATAAAPSNTAATPQ